MRRVPTGPFIDHVSRDMRDLLTRHRRGVKHLGDIADVVTCTAHTMNDVFFPEQHMNGVGSAYSDFMDSYASGDTVGVQNTIIPGAIETPVMDSIWVYDNAIAPVISDATAAAGNAAASVLKPVTSLLVLAAITVGLVVFYPEIRAAMNTTHHD